MYIFPMVFRSVTHETFSPPSMTQTTNLLLHLSTRNSLSSTVSDTKPL